MKTKLVFAAALLLLSVAGFAQQASLKTEQAAKVSSKAPGSSVDENLNASSTTSVKTSPVKKVAIKAGPSTQEARIDAGNQGNNVNQKTSLNDRTAVSAPSAESSANLGSGMKMVSGTTKSSTKAAKTASVKTKAGIQHAIKPKPASLKLQTQMRTGAGLKIK